MIEETVASGGAAIAGAAATCRTVEEVTERFPVESNKIREKKYVSRTEKTLRTGSVMIQNNGSELERTMYGQRTNLNQTRGEDAKVEREGEKSSSSFTPSSI